MTKEFNLGLSLFKQEKYSEALSVMQGALKISPDNPDFNNLSGLILLEMNRPAEALNYSLKAVKLQPDNFIYYGILGLIWQGLGEYQKAESCFRKIIGLDPDNIGGHTLLADILLLTGQLEEGFKEYEWRFFEGPDGVRSLPKQYSGDTPLDGKTIYIYCEQGFGDTILCCRYLKLLKNENRYIIFECPEALLDLLKNTEGVDRIVESPPDHKPVVDYDISISLMSLPKIFNTGMETIPAEIPYIKASPELNSFWQKKFSNIKGLKVGVVWKSKFPNPTFAKRSVSIDNFYEIAKEMNGITFFSLQKGQFSEELEQLPILANFISLSKYLNSFSNTAAIIENLDLIISIDTAVVNLAAAMGKPVWPLLAFNADWRWFTERRDNPWYPTTLLFRQPAPGDWDSVFFKVKEQLQLLLNLKAGR